MKCPVCGNALVERSGKYGPFVCCPKGNHGTFSIQSGTMHFTGQVGQMLKSNRIKEVYETLRLQSIDSPVMYQPTLTQLMNVEMAKFGWDSSDPMNQLTEFAVGSPEEVWDDEERNNPDAWWNARMY